MSEPMDWLYFHYILPTIQEENQGEFAKSIQNIQGLLDIPQTIDFEMAMEFYATRAFRLGLRTGVSLRQLLSEE